MLVYHVIRPFRKFVRNEVRVWWRVLKVHLFFSAEWKKLYILMQALMRLEPMMELTIALHSACFTIEQSDAIIRIVSHNK